ncbi:MAG: alkaline phosphatase D family protein [Vicinamibacterales bacterium]
MPVSRREFLNLAAVAGATPLLAPWLRLQPGVEGRTVFLHGVASGDPLADRVMLWTRVSGAAPAARPRVRWEVARDDGFRQIVRRGELTTGRDRDFTVKVDVTGLTPGTRYHYRFQAVGERSRTGRTRTLPGKGTTRVSLAVASCSNLPQGYFNAYRGIANRADLDAVLHLGDYYYEYANARYGDGTRFGRIPAPNKEITSLEDYRTRHAQYKTDPDLQDAHRLHPWITVWDDHEITNNTWRDGAQNHNPDQGEGDWTARKHAAIRAYYEWMPIREQGAPSQARIYRTFRFGGLADLIMLDTRVVARDQQAAQRDQLGVIEDPRRSLLGRAQEAWLFGELQKSRARGARWQVLGQQVMFAPMAPWGQPSGNTDAWDGYRPARDRVVDFLETHDMRNAVVLTGDVHSSWAYDIAKDPWGAYDAGTGRGTRAIELVTPSITSPSGWNAATAADRLRQLKAARPHLRWADGLSHGYVVLNLERDALQSDWFGVPTIESRTSEEHFVKGFTSEYNNPHLVEASSPAPSA